MYESTYVVASVYVSRANLWLLFSRIVNRRHYIFIKISFRWCDGDEIVDDICMCNISHIVMFKVYVLYLCISHFFLLLPNYFSIYIFKCISTIHKTLCIQSCIQGPTLDCSGRSPNFWGTFHNIFKKAHNISWSRQKNSTPFTSKCCSWPCIYSIVIEEALCVSMYVLM